MKQLSLIFLLSSLGLSGQNIVPATKDSSINNQFSVSCLNYQFRIEERPLVEDWIKKDIDQIENIFNKVPKYGFTLESLTSILPNLLNGKGNASLYRHDLGNNLELLDYMLHGGYGSLRFEILHFDGKVLRINEYISNYAELIENRFLSRINVSLTCDYGFTENLMYYPVNIIKYKIAYPDFYLDTLTKVTENKDNEALFFFSDYSALRGHLQSPMHAMESYWEPAFNHVRYLVQNKKIELLENLLHSPLTSGRVFAASALNYLKNNNIYQPSKNILSKINEIEKNGTTFISGIFNSSIGKFEYDYYDVYKDFEELIKK